MSPSRSLINTFIHSKIFWPMVAIAAILLFNFIFIPGFFNIEIKNGHLFGSTIDILNRATPLIIISLGLTLVIANESIDISVGAVLAITAAIVLTLIPIAPLWLAIVAGIGVGMACGMWNGMLVAYIGVQPMVATLILWVAGRGIAQLITGGQILTVYNDAYSFIGTGFLFGLPFAVFIAAAVFIILMLLKKRTAFGLFLETVGANLTSSKFVGIHHKRIIFFTYVICGLCAGLAGIIVSSNVSSADANNAGLWIELDAILAVVIGGTSMRGGRFYLGGTLAGALFIQTITTTIYTMGIPPEVIMVLKAVAVIIVCLLQSEAFRKMFVRKGKQVADV